MASIKEAIRWIADNDESGELDIEVMETLISVLLVADLFGKTPTEIATRVVKVRKAWRRNWIDIK